MSDKRLKMRQRRQSFRRLHGEKKAVSPVVATLILILIAVAAAAALYLWLVAWQGGVTKGIGSPGAQYTVTIGGSTSVYPFAAQAANWFEQNNSDVVISVNQGGSGAGAAAVCSGQVDIGEMSAFYSAATLETSYGCPATLNEQIVAYDGVDLITQTANPHGLQSMNWETLQSVIAQASTTAPSSGFIYGLSESNGATFNGVAVPSTVPAQGSEFAWDQLPACATAQTLCASESGVSVAALTAPLMPNTVAGPETETSASTITSAVQACSVSGPTTLTGTSTFAIDGYNTSTTFAPPTAVTEATTTTCTTAPTFTAPASGTILSAAENAGNTAVTLTWSASYTAATGTGTGNAGAYTSAGDTAKDSGISQNLATPVSVSSSATALCTAPTAAKADICGTYTPATGVLNTPGSFSTVCGFAVCAGGSGAGTGSGQYGAAIHIYYRSDVSGTTQSFLARLVAAGGSAGGSAASLQFTGCSGDNQFDGCGGTYASAISTGENGNPAVIQGVAGDANGLGYASDGLVQASDSGVLPVNFQGYGQTVVVTLQGESTALKAIAKGIADVRNGGATYATDQAYIGWRPFMNAETSPPTGEVLRYLEYVMDPANNQNIASATAEISVYASGLAGVVPVTPVTGYQEQL